MGIRGPEDSTPLVEYTDQRLWANPEENQQYQVKLVRVTDDYGVVRNFSYMNRWRVLPKPGTFYHIFSVGGLDAGYWNLQQNILRRNPIDRWVNMGWLAKVRGLQLDLYNTKGYQYSRSKAWVMTTYDGLTLIAFEKLNSYPIRYETDMWFRCYTSSVDVDLNDTAEAETGNPYIYETMTHENPAELAEFTARYSKWKLMPGFTGTYHNGVYFNGAPNAITNLLPGDVVEIWHDPTVVRAEIYRYRDLKDFYSTLDAKRKLILHPAKRKGDFTIRYFDDNDYFILGKKNRGLYLHRNDVTTVRQLTHCDVAIADDQIQNYAEYHPDLALVADVSILVLIRKSGREYQWPNEHQRIRYLYRFPDVDIVKAFTGERANMPEWTANGLESGPVMTLLRKQWGSIKKEDAILSTGYNAATRVLSETPLRATYLLGDRGVEVPISYRANFTAWEHDEAGQLLGWYGHGNTRYYPPVNETCTKVEFTLGQAGRTLDWVVTKDDTLVDEEYNYRVYTSAWNVILGELAGPLTDVTGDDTIYIIEDGKVVWTGLDKVNQRGLILSNKKALGYTFELEHIDHSLAFAVTHIYEQGGLVFPVSFAQVDIWLNGHPLIDKVDWIFDDEYCYIHNKEFIVDGPQTITVRAHGFHTDMDAPNSDTELGFVDAGVIGRFDRYNLRADRVTRTVINGALYLTDEVPRAERDVPDDQTDPLNGKPYMVKHVYCPIRYVEGYDNYPLFERSREVDQRVSDYMTKWLPKPRNNAEEIHWEANDPQRPQGTGVPVIANLQDKYRVFSQFMNVVVNGVLNGLIRLPTLEEGATVYTNQSIEEVVRSYKWWLKYDPVILDFDRRYFAIMPYANFGMLTVTAQEFLFFKQVNDLYLKSVCAIEGHFEVNNNV